tara:strand:+ start:251 stop:1018 length:768 start_codon:yes stop_codon:yes gene_type:complete
MDIKQSRAIITGGASGLGLATAEMIVNHGGKVNIIDVSEEKFSSLPQKIQESCFFKTADVSKEVSISNCISDIVREEGPVNLIVNCAGLGSAEKVLNKNGYHDSDIFNNIINVNLIGTFNVIKISASHMQNNDLDNDGFRGVIINTASIAAFDGQIGQAAYSASKSGIVGLTLPVARELSRYGIRICTIAPGLFETPMLKGLPEKAYQSLVESTLFPKRLGKPSEYALMVKSIYENNMLNGETIRLDGALRLAPK